MTTGFVDVKPPAPVAPAGTDAAATDAASTGRPAVDRGLMIRRLAGVVVTTLGVFFLALLVYLYAFTPLTHNRDQQRLLHSLTGDASSTFALVSGRVPPEGSAVALVRIPSLGLSQAVVEGTSAADLQAGPGHMPGTALPGTPGNAVIAGKRVTFGGPFSRSAPSDAVPSSTSPTASGPSSTGCRPFGRCRPATVMSSRPVSPTP